MGATAGLSSSAGPRYDIVHEPGPYDSPAVTPRETNKATPGATAGLPSSVGQRYDMVGEPRRYDGSAVTPREIIRSTYSTAGQAGGATRPQRAKETSMRHSVQIAVIAVLSTVASFVLSPADQLSFYIFWVVIGGLSMGSYFLGMKSGHQKTPVRSRDSNSPG